MEYLILDLLILAFPLLATFHPRISYFRKLKAVFLSIAVVGAVFIPWDVVATARGHWSFNPSHLIGFSFLGLPIEEIMFFFVVPYSCLFIYESLCSFCSDSEVFFKKGLYAGLGFIFLLASLASASMEYTSLVLFLSSFFLFYSAFRLERLLSSSFYWAYIFITLFLFIVFNFFLTSLPVVIYGQGAILNIRFLTIPLEDFLYNYLMLSFYISAYLWAKGRFYSHDTKSLNDEKQAG